MPKLGPGTLTIGATGTEVDASCLINNAKITNEKDQADSTTKLCGDVVTGAVTYTYALEGNTDIDPADPDGLFMLCHNNAGQEFPFTFVPNTADGTTAAGVIVLDPLAFGADNYGDDLTSDFSFALKDKPTYTAAAPPPLSDDTSGDPPGDTSGDAYDVSDAVGVGV